MKYETKVNHRIKAEKVMVVAENGEQLGVIDLQEALKIAEESALDLVQVAPNADPPVCRIMDYGKYKYEQEQKAKKARKHQSMIIVKEMKMRPKIDHHDYETKKKHVVRFLSQGNKVKITIMFRGREMVHPEIGQEILEQLAEDVSGVGTVESPPKQDGRNMIMVLMPLKVAQTTEKKAEIKGEATGSAI